MSKEKMSPETATMLAMQRLIGIADEVFDQVECKSGNQFMVITIANDFISCDLMNTQKCEECGENRVASHADLTYNRKTKLSHWYK